MSGSAGVRRWAGSVLCVLLLVLGGCESSLEVNRANQQGDAGWDVGGSVRDADDDADLNDAAADEDVDLSDADDMSDADDLDDASDASDATSPEDSTDATDISGEPDIREDATPDPDPDPELNFDVEMTYVTANIGRNYGGRADVKRVINRIGDTVEPKSGPKFIGWQEIGEGDPCGNTCEEQLVRRRFGAGWQTFRPRGARPSGGGERVKVPVSAKAPGSGAARAKFASPGWAGVSPTRFVTVVHYPERNISIVNTHLIAGAWSCKSHVNRRKDYWRRGWNALKAEVAREHDRGRNVIVTGDLNRGRRKTNCNPAWNPASLHARAAVVGGAGIDYIIAVPSAGKKFVVAKRANGTRKKGSIQLGIDSHNAHWLRGRFVPK